VVVWLGVVVWLCVLECEGAELWDGALACGAGALFGAELVLCCAQTNAGTSIMINNSDLLRKPVFIFHLIADSSTNLGRSILADHKHGTLAGRFRRAAHSVYFEALLFRPQGKNRSSPIRTIDCPGILGAQTLSKLRPPCNRSLLLPASHPDPCRTSAV